MSWADLRGGYKNRITPFVSSLACVDCRHHRFLTAAESYLALVWLSFNCCLFWTVLHQSRHMCVWTTHLLRPLNPILSPFIQRRKSPTLMYLAYVASKMLLVLPFALLVSHTKDSIVVPPPIFLLILLLCLLFEAQWLFIDVRLIFSWISCKSPFEPLLSWPVPYFFQELTAFELVS